ncbi:MAG: molybdenum cofactor biosynthesis protein MoaE [Pirellulales bacterium]
MSAAEFPVSVELTEDPIDTTSVLQSVHSVRAGAVVLFLGTVRELTGDQVTQSLVYEAFGPMARYQLELLCQTAAQRWPIVGCRVVHRVGPLALGEVAVAVAVSTPHRADAFQAAQWLMDTIKQQVPIWKKEIYRDGRTEWVHPAESTPGASS